MGTAEPIPVDRRTTLQVALEASPSVFELLRTVRSRRVGLGYRVDAGGTERHPVTGRTLSMPAGPQRFVSRRAPRPLSADEEALLAWAACGPNGIVAWEASMGGGFHQLSTLAGRTAPEANNIHATDLLVVNDAGTWLYRPNLRPSEPVACPGEPEEFGAFVRDLYATGLVPVLPHRPDIDFAQGYPGSGRGGRNGTHQYNLNRPGSTWFLPLTDAGALLSGIVDAFAGKGTYYVDEFHGGRVAGLAEFVRPGMLEVPVPITVHEQGVLRTSTYPAGCMVQNIRLAGEAMGLGVWALSGYDQDLLFGTHPEVSAGLGFEHRANPGAPLPTGARHTLGRAGVKTSTCVPSPRFPTARALVDSWLAERYGPGGWGDREHSALAGDGSPWPASRAAAIVEHPLARAPGWCWDAALAYVSYCVDTFGHWPVTYDPMLAGFGAVVHHVDPDYYDNLLRPGYLTPRIRHHHSAWH